MSSQGRFSSNRNTGGRGNSRGGRGSGSSSSNYDRSKTTKNGSKSISNNSKDELKFAPHCSGKTQLVMHDMVRDHIIIQVQKNYKHGNDLAKSLRELECATDAWGNEPDRDVVDIDNESLVMGKDTQNASLKSQMKQAGYDLKHQEELKACMARKNACDDNKCKACASMFGHCNKTMQS